MNKNTKIELNVNDMKEILMEAIDEIIVENDSLGTDVVQEFVRKNVDLLLEELDEELVMQAIRHSLVDAISNGLVDGLDGITEEEMK